MSVTPHKIQGFKSHFKFTPVGGGSAVTLTSLSEFEVNIKGDALDASDHDGAGWKSYLAGMLEWDGTVKAVYVEGDATQPDLLAVLTGQVSVTGTFYPEVAAASGENSYVGTFIVTSYKHSGKNNDVQGLDFTIKGTGPLVPTAQ